MACSRTMCARQWNNKIWNAGAVPIHDTLLGGLLRRRGVQVFLTAGYMLAICSPNEPFGELLCPSAQTHLRYVSCTQQPMPRGFTLSRVGLTVEGEWANSQQSTAFQGFFLRGPRHHDLLPMGMYQKPRDGDPPLGLDYRAHQLSAGWGED